MMTQRFVIDAEVENEHGAPFLALRNINGTDCFIIAVINAMASFEELRRQIVAAGAETGSTLHRLAEIISGEAADVLLLRQSLPHHLQFGQQDAWDVLNHFENYVLPTTSRTLLQYGFQTTTACANGHSTQRDVVGLHCYYVAELPETIETADFNELVDGRAFRGRCEQCDGQTTTKTQFQLTADQPFVIIGLNDALPSGEGRRTIEITGFDPESVFFPGKIL
jgi:hypothetical protein